MANNKKYVSLSKLQVFFNNLKETFAFKAHAHNDAYYTKEEIDNCKFITIDEIDAICDTNVIIVDEETEF